MTPRKDQQVAKRGQTHVRSTNISFVFIFSSGLHAGLVKAAHKNPHIIHLSTQTVNVWQLPSDPNPRRGLQLAPICGLTVKLRPDVSNLLLHQLRGS